MRLPYRAALNALVLAVCAVFAVVVLTDGTSHGDNPLYWVQVKEDSPDAVILKTPSRWADAVATLPFNAQVEVLADLSTREDKPQPFFQIKYRQHTGYVKRNVLSEESPMQHTDREADLTATGAAAANSASKGLGDQNEKVMRASDEEYEKAMQQVDETESRIDRIFYNKNKRDDVGDPTVARKKYEEFGRAGGLVAGEGE
jgi:hypothetical protein